MSIFDGEETKKLELRLGALSIQKQFPGRLLDNVDPLLPDDIRMLLSYSSILSLSENDADFAMAYEIITRLLEITRGEDVRVILAAEIVLSRIGNFPGRDLLRERYAESIDADISYPLRLECLAREAENSFFQDQIKISLTNFQYKLLDALGSGDSLSVSAPTSAGKSFVLGLDIIRKIKSGDGVKSIVYVVPTRALITEVSQRIRSELRGHQLSDVLVRTAPFPVSAHEIKIAVIYVLTQERLMSFINNKDVTPFVSSLIVDEAHEIQKGKRGVVLQNAIDITLSRFPKADVFFASPLIKNPSYFLSLFGRNNSGRYFVETLSPVSQNIILLSEVSGKPSQVQVSRLNGDFVSPVGRFEIDFRFRGHKAFQRASFALSVCRDDDSVIVFSNGPADAEAVAAEAGKLIKGYEPTQQVLEFVEFIRSEIHNDYPLIDVMLHGSSFHYGRMPSLVRSGVERLFKQGDIRIICCTSTLLQGVNLPAKHIVIENPKSGDEAMSRSDFLNLAGRAGRLLKEFHGNIWCIRPSMWAEKSYAGEGLQEVRSAIDGIMLDGGSLIRDLISGEVADVAAKDIAEAAFGKLYHDYVTVPFKLEAYRTNENSDVLNQTVDTLGSVVITLPSDILEVNKSLRPDHLQALYERLNGELILSEYILISPFIAGAKHRFDRVIEVVAECFEWAMSDQFGKYISYVSYNWMRGEPIRKMLADRIDFLALRNPGQKPSGVIRDFLDVLEDSVRFKLVKYVSAYIDILRHVLVEKGVPELAEEIEPYHIYLEFGSCNRHALNLMALGLSRFTSLYLQNKFDFAEVVQPEEYLKAIREINIESINMPLLCKREVRELAAH